MRTLILIIIALGFGMVLGDSKSKAGNVQWFLDDVGHYYEKAKQDLAGPWHFFEEPKVIAQAVYYPEGRTPLTVTPKAVSSVSARGTTHIRTVYVIEYSDWKPPTGAPLFYVPYPNTLCMLGEGPNNEVRIIYEKRPGSCEKLIQVSDGHLVRPIKHRIGGDVLGIKQ